MSFCTFALGAGGWFPIEKEPEASRFKIVWMGSKLVTDKLVLLDSNIAFTACSLQDQLAQLLGFEHANEVKASAGPYTLTPTPLQRKKYFYSDMFYHGGASKDVAEEAFDKLRPAWRFLFDNKDTPIVVTRYAKSEIEAAQSATFLQPVLELRNRVDMCSVYFDCFQ